MAYDSQGTVAHATSDLLIGRLLGRIVAIVYSLYNRHDVNVDVFFEKMRNGLLCSTTVFPHHFLYYTLAIITAQVVGGIKKYASVDIKNVETRLHLIVACTGLLW